jgi:hypothetical protein
MPKPAPRTPQSSRSAGKKPTPQKSNSKKAPRTPQSAGSRSTGTLPMTPNGRQHSSRNRNQQAASIRQTVTMQALHLSGSGNAKSAAKQHKQRSRSTPKKGDPNVVQRENDHLGCTFKVILHDDTFY